MATVISRSTDAATVTPALVMPFEGEDEAGTVVHRIPGREFPDVTLAPALGSGGTLRLFFLTFADAEAARGFHRAAATFTIASDQEWLPAAYVPQGRIRRAQQAENLRRWVLEVPYEEIAP
jgi:hypothetical protein